MPPPCSRAYPGTGLHRTSRLNLWPGLDGGCELGPFEHTTLQASALGLAAVRATGSHPRPSGTCRSAQRGCPPVWERWATLSRPPRSPWPGFLPRGSPRPSGPRSVGGSGRTDPQAARARSRRVHSRPR